MLRCLMTSACFGGSMAVCQQPGQDVSTSNAKNMLPEPVAPYIRWLFETWVLTLAYPVHRHL